MKFYRFTLSNGMRAVHVPVESDISHCGLIINAGSRDEGVKEQGLAHFIEHMIFKGTTKRKAYHILNRLDAVGGDLNAYTSKEETCIYASFLNRYYERAVELIADITFNPVFPEKEIAKEKDVIADEIQSYQDSPSEQIFDDFEEKLFQGHPIGRNILGTNNSLKNIKQESLGEFTKKHYAPERMVFSSIGNLPISVVKSLCEKYFEPVKSGSHKYKRAPFKNYKPFHQEIKRKTNLVHTLIGNVAYDAKHKNRISMILLNNILGGPAMNSRLNLNIREKYGFAYTIESMYSAYEDTGMFGVYAATDISNVEKCNQLIKKELKKLCDDTLGSTQLHSAKQQLMGQVALSQENRPNLMLALGKSLTVYNKIDTVEEINRKIEAITASQILNVANEIFDEKKMSSLTYT